MKPLPSIAVDHVRVLNNNHVQPSTSTLAACRHAKLLPVRLQLLADFLDKKTSDI